MALSLSPMITILMILCTFDIAANQPTCCCLWACGWWWSLIPCVWHNKISSVWITAAVAPRANTRSQDHAVEPLIGQAKGIKRRKATTTIHHRSNQVRVVINYKSGRRMKPNRIVHAAIDLARKYHRYIVVCKRSGVPTYKSADLFFRALPL